MDLLLTSTGDIDFSKGDFHTVTGPDEVVQRLRLQLGVRQGEWALDLLFGVDWLGLVFIKNPSLSIINAHLKSIIVGTEGVTRLLSYTAEVTGRTLDVEFEVLTDTGDVVEGSLTADPDGSAAAIQIAGIASIGFGICTMPRRKVD